MTRKNNTLDGCTRQSRGKEAAIPRPSTAELPVRLVAYSKFRLSKPQSDLRNGAILHAWRANTLSQVNAEYYIVLNTLHEKVQSCERVIC